MKRLYSGVPRRPGPSLRYGLSVAVTLGMLTMSAARADTVALLLPDMCGDPAATFDYEWGKVANILTSGVKVSKAYIYNPTPTATINPIDTADGFGNASNTDLLVIAHGRPGKVGSVPADTFAAAVQAAHPTAFRTVQFAVCSAAVAPAKGDSAARALQNAYGNRIGMIAASNAVCALAGNGSTDLASALYRANPPKTDAALYTAVVGNIMNDWAAPAQAYKTKCETYLAPGRYDRLAAFMQTVYNRYSTADMSPNGDPKKSINYLLLVKNNTGGTAFVTCGKNNGVNCP